MLKLDEKEQRIAEQIVGSIDEDGYLRRETSAIVDDLAFRQNIQCHGRRSRSIIQRIQQFDPPGVAARDLQECLLLQLQRQKDEGKECRNGHYRLSQNILMSLPKSITKRYSAGLNLDEDQLKEVMQQIIRLNPKPGGNVGEHQQSRKLCGA